MGLNFTSTKPSLRLASSLMQTGYVAWPDCFNTFGLLGAVSSATTAHRAWPEPVWVAIQPVGAFPVSALSKFTVSAGAAANSNAVRMTVETFMGCSVLDFGEPRSLSVRR